MADDRDNLVTVAVFDSPGEADLARNRLESIGIKTMLGEENSAALGWALTGAQGGIKVQVAAHDEETARDFLDDKPWLEAAEESLSLTASQVRAEEGDGPLTRREKEATRAFRSAIFGFLIPPFLWFYAGYLLVGVCFSRERLQGTPRRHAFLAGGTMSLIGLAILTVLGLFLFPPISPPKGLRAYPHDPGFVGRWQGHWTMAGGDTQVDMELGPTGELRYRESGVSTLDCSGSWAYKNYALYIQCEKVTQGTDPYGGRVVGRLMLKFQPDEMVLQDANGILRMTRLK